MFLNRAIPVPLNSVVMHLHVSIPLIKVVTAIFNPSLDNTEIKDPPSLMSKKDTKKYSFIESDFSIVPTILSRAVSFYIDIVSQMILLQFGR